VGEAAESVDLLVSAGSVERGGKQGAPAGAAAPSNSNPPHLGVSACAMLFMAQRTRPLGMMGWAMLSTVWVGVWWGGV
jgi:hypothetical protein